MTKAKEKELLKRITETLEMINKNTEEWLEDYNNTEDKPMKLDDNGVRAYKLGLAKAKLSFIVEDFFQ